MKLKIIAGNYPFLIGILYSFYTARHYLPKGCYLNGEIGVWKSLVRRDSAVFHVHNDDNFLLKLQIHTVVRLLYYKSENIIFAL